MEAMVSNAPIFLTGFARSGTTWVNRIMRDYFDVGFVNEGQFIVTFGKRISDYGDLGRAANRSRLVRSLAGDPFFSILDRNYKITMDWAEIEQASKSFADVVRGVLRTIAIGMGKHRIGSKYPVFGHHLDLLNDLFPDCLVIHVIRDGRDCALSHKGVTWGHQNTYSAAIHWRRYLETARYSARALGGRYFEIRYEDLLLEPEVAVGRLERFVTGESDGQIASKFLKDHPPLKTEKAGGWRMTMPARAQAIFESEAGDMLESLGYPLTGDAHRLSPFSKLAYRAHDRLSREGWHFARKMFKSIPERK